MGSPHPINPLPQVEGEELGSEKAPKTAPEEEEEEKGRKEEDGEKETKKVGHAPPRQATPLPIGHALPISHTPPIKPHPFWSLPLKIGSAPFSEAPPPLC